MKVLKRTSNHKTKTREVNCSRCKSTLEVTKKDIKKKVKSGNDRGESYQYTTHFYICPVCGKKTITSETL